MISAITKTLYCHPRFENNPRTGRLDKIRDDFLMYVVGKDDGSREVKIIREPTYTYYLAKESMGYHRLSVDIEKVTPITVPYSRRHSYMAESIGLKEDYQQAKKDFMQKRFWVQQNLMNNPQIYQADFDIEEKFKLDYIDQNGDYTPDLKYFTAFTDIEVRADLTENPDSHIADAPICSIQHLDSRTETVHIMVLNDPLVPEIQSLFNDLNGFVTEFQERLDLIRQECIDKTIKGKGDPTQVHSFKFNYQFYLLNDEKDLIIKYFDLIRDTKPDTVGIWNMNFDMLYISNRCKKLGLNMADLISDPVFPPEYRFFNYVEDHERYKEKVETHFSRFFDKLYSTSVTQWYCQMALHSNLRKRFLEPSYKLDEIGEKYAYVRKFNLADEGYHIKDVYKKNFRIFLKYAMMDVIVQYMIEHNNQDVPRYMIQCAITKFEHGIKKTFGIKNELYRFLKERGQVIGNNRTYNTENVERLQGAIVASPGNIGEKGEVLLGTHSHIYRNCVDLDVASEYPNLIISFNIIKSTIYGRLISVYNPVIKDEFKINVPVSDGATFTKLLQTIDSSVFEIGSKYFNLPDLEDVLSHFDNMLAKTS